MQSLTRRHLLAATSLATAAAALGATPERKLGMIFPPKGYAVPPEAKLLYPTGIEFLADDVAFNGMSIESYIEAVPRIVPAALRLKARGAEAISIMGTSLTFFKGAAYNQELIDSVKRATGLPATSMSTGIVDGLKVAGAKRIAVATAYTDEVNNPLKQFLTESGFHVEFIRGLNLVRATGNVTQEQLFDFSAKVFADTKGADTLLISCGGLKTIDLLKPLEAQCKVPVVSSTPHALMNAVRMVGAAPRVTGWGTVLSKA
jgi:arylmalonate decarboxylase